MTNHTQATVEEVARIIEPGAFHEDPIDRHKYCSPRRVDVVQSEAREKARRILALPSVGCPAGWKLVPVEPTLDMQKAYFDEIDKNMNRVQNDARFGRFCNNRLAYTAMLAAAPAPPQAGEDRP